MLRSLGLCKPERLIGCSDFHFCHRGFSLKVVPVQWSNERLHYWHYLYRAVCDCMSQPHGDAVILGQKIGMWAALPAAW